MNKNTLDAIKGILYSKEPDGAVMITAYRRGALVYNKKNKATQAHERVFLKGALYGIY